MYQPLGFLIFRDSKAGMVPSTSGMCRYISHSEIVCRGPKKFENPCSRRYPGSWTRVSSSLRGGKKLCWFESHYRHISLFSPGSSTPTSSIHSPFIVLPLPHICNAALSSAVFPDRLNYAIAKPIFKKGSKKDISKYRPISLLTSFSKILEKLIYNRVYTHFETNSILVQEHIGFRMQHSTEQAAFSLINCTLMAMNKNTDQESKTSIEEISLLWLFRGCWTQIWY